MQKCLIIGSTVCDVILYVDALPGSEEDVHLHSQKVSIGGCAFNTMKVIHDLKVPYTFLSPIGKGIYGNFVADELKRLGIRSEVYSDEENGCCYCMVEENGNRSFLSYHRVEYTFQSKWLDNLVLDEYDYIYLCGLEVEDVDGEELVESLSRFRGQIVFAPGPRATKIPRTRIEKIFKHNPLLHMNKTEAIALSGKENYQEAIAYLRSITNAGMIITDGANGSYFYGEEEFFMPGYPAKAIDTVGAGDSHIGAFLACLCHGLSARDSLDFANLFSSKVVEIAGVSLQENQLHELQQRLQHCLVK